MFKATSGLRSRYLTNARYSVGSPITTAGTRSPDLVSPGCRLVNDAFHIGAPEASVHSQGVDCPARSPTQPRGSNDNGSSSSSRIAMRVRG